MNSEYFLKWKELLQSQELRDIADNYGYKIVFNLHPQMKMYMEDFKVSDYIITNASSRIQELFCNSSLMITDYSSVAFEMAYLNKPVIYYQFDKEVFFANHTLQQGYFNYEEDGFGPVVKTQEGLLKEAKKILEDGCKVGEPYKTNMANTFLFRDGKCCERVYEKIIEVEDCYCYDQAYLYKQAENAFKSNQLDVAWFICDILIKKEIYTEDIIENFLYSSARLGKIKEGIVVCDKLVDKIINFKKTLKIVCLFLIEANEIKRLKAIIDKCKQNRMYCEDIIEIEVRIFLEENRIANAKEFIEKLKEYLK
ncbi:hypothetical protein HEBU111660_08865 [Helicobacter burdigaliensis]